MAEYDVSLVWDSEAGVWLATSDDIPGLVLEGGSLDALIERVRFAVPELLVLDSVCDASVVLCFRSERHELVAV